MTKTTRLFSDFEEDGGEFWICERCYHITEYANDDPSTLNVNYRVRCGSKITDFTEAEIE